MASPTVDATEPGRTQSCSLRPVSNRDAVERPAGGAEVDAVGKIDVPEAPDPHRLVHRDGFDEQPEPGGEDPSAGPQHPVAQIEHVLEHVLVEELVAHLLVQDDIDRLGWRELAAVGLDELDVGEAVVLGDLAGDLDEVGVLHRIHLLRSGAAGHEGEQTGAGAEVEDDVAGVHVAVDAAVVRIDADRVAQHLLVFGDAGEVGLVHEVVDDAHQPIARRDLLGREPDRRSDRPGRHPSRPIDHAGRLRRPVRDVGRSTVDGRPLDGSSQTH